VLHYEMQMNVTVSQHNNIFCKSRAASLAKND